jgi:rhodanese-related sulfurtransferase
MRQPTERLSWFACGLLAAALYAAPGVAQDAAPLEPEADEEVFPPFIEADELRRLIQQGSQDILIVDNAPTLVWEEAHIPGAVSFPWVRQITDPVTFPRAKTLILYCPCTHDEDSIDMAKQLVELGYFKIKVLEGGWFKWEELGYETASAADERRPSAAN